MTTVDYKSKIAKEDINWGVGTFQRRLSTGELQTVNQVNIYPESAWLDVRAYGADPTGLTDSYNALQDLITDAPNGSVIFFPVGDFKITQPLTFVGKEYITVRGSSRSNGGTNGTTITYAGGGHKAVLYLPGTRYCTFTDIGFYSTSTDDPPKTVIAMGRNATTLQCAGNTFRNVRVWGYASEALVYSIAAEGTTWDQIEFFMLGSGKYAFYTSQADDLSISGGDFITETNLSFWVSQFAFYNYSTTAGAAVVYINGRAATGDIYFRNGFMAASAGSAVQINVVDDADDTAFGTYVFESIRTESIDNVAIDYDFYLSASGATGTVGYLNIRNVNMSCNSTYNVYGANSVTLNEFVIENSHSLYAGGISIYNTQKGRIYFSDGPIIARNSAYGTHVIKGWNRTVTLPGWNNLIQDSYVTEELKYQGQIILGNYEGTPLLKATSNPPTTPEGYIRFNGYVASDDTWSLSNAVIGSWTYLGMIQVNVNGTAVWIPYYSYTP